MTNYANYLQQSLQITLEVGSYLLAEWDKEIRYFSKKSEEGNHIATNIDRQADKMYQDFFHKHTPGFSIYSEESTRDTGEYTWVIDPLDGTSNYRVHIPLFATQVCLLHNNVPQLAVIHMPAINLTVSTLAGNGIEVNGKTFTRSDSDVPISFSLASITRGGDNRTYIDLIESVRKLVSTVRIYGSSAVDLAFIAIHRTQLFVSKDSKIYDILPGALCVQESGQSIFSLDGSPYTPESTSVVAGSPLAVKTYLDTNHEH